MVKPLDYYLKEFGLSSTESKLYLALLEKGPSTVLMLSEYTKINRTTTHINADLLVKKGLATYLKVGKKRRIIAEPPEKLNTLLENERLELKRKETALPDILKGIHDSISHVKENTSSEVKYYEGKENISRLYDEILKAKVLRTYGNYTNIISIFPLNGDKFIDAVKEGLELWDIFEYGTIDTSFEKLAEAYINYHLKTFPKSLKLNSMDYLIYDDCIATIQGGDNPTAIVVKNKHLAENARAIYDLLWSLLD